MRKSRPKLPGSVTIKTGKVDSFSSLRLSDEPATPEQRPKIHDS